jgi:hypothetical protein
MTISLHIDRLILEGISVAQHERPLLLAALSEELGMLLAQSGLALDLQNGTALPHLRSPAAVIDAGAPAAELGRQIAHSVYAGIGSPPMTGEGRG